MTFFFETASEKEEIAPDKYIEEHSFLHKFNSRIEVMSKAPGWRAYPHILIDINSPEEMIELINESGYPIVVYGRDDDRGLSGKNECIYPTIKLYDYYLE